MKKRISAILIICLAVSTLIFAFLWIAEPEKSQEHINALVITMEHLSKDIEDPNGHGDMLNLLNVLQE